MEYTIKEGKLSVYYSQGDCSAGGTYDIPKGAVISISIYLNKPVAWSALALEASRFDKREINDLPGNLTFVNERMGVWLFGTDAVVTELTLRPSADKSQMECRSGTKFNKRGALPHCVSARSANLVS